MLDQLAGRLQAAQNRLRSALLAGQPTAAHRQAVATIQTDIDGEFQRQRQTDAERDQHRAEATTRRAAEIAAEAHQRIAASIPKAPTKPRSTQA